MSGEARPRVLVVDDAVTIRRILTGWLHGAGYDVSEARDGREGVEVCRAVRPDLVLLDIDMPEVDGRTALRQIKADPARCEIPVLFLTARRESEEVALGLELGAQDYLRKPCEEAELLARVGNALRMDEQRRRLERQAADLEALSTTDPLTGLANRRRLAQQHDAIDVAARATGGHVGFVLLDIDHFKRINDEHGHDAGDGVLRVVAGRLQALAGDSDLVVRWGGEEFLVVAPGRDHHGVAALGEAVRAAIGDDPLAVSPDLTLAVTVSVGCVSAPAAALEAAVTAADHAMYDAKTTGRNGVRVGVLAG